MPYFRFLTYDRWTIYNMRPDYAMEKLTINEAIQIQKEMDLDDAGEAIAAGDTMSLSQAAMGGAWPPRGLHEFTAMGV